eukprot:Hpha_TRINITY_DN16725_c3_g1::TRINITY_DN16725_c3_g1_i3::g.77448::m.77448
MLDSSLFERGESCGPLAIVHPPHEQPHFSCGRSKAPPFAKRAETIGSLPPAVYPKQSERERKKATSRQQREKCSYRNIPVGFVFSPDPQSLAAVGSALQLGMQGRALKREGSPCNAVVALKRPRGDLPLSHPPVPEFLLRAVRALAPPVVVSHAAPLRAPRRSRSITPTPRPTGSRLGRSCQCARISPSTIRKVSPSPAGRRTSTPARARDQRCRCKRPPQLRVSVGSEGGDGAEWQDFSVEYSRSEVKFGEAELQWYAHCSRRWKGQHRTVAELERALSLQKGRRHHIPAAPEGSAPPMPAASTPRPPPLPFSLGVEC